LAVTPFFFADWRVFLPVPSSASLSLRDDENEDAAQDHDGGPGQKGSAGEKGFQVHSFQPVVGLSREDAEPRPRGAVWRDTDYFIITSAASR
jgi:hypothetical protein